MKNLELSHLKSVIMSRRLVLIMLAFVVLLMPAVVLLHSIDHYGVNVPNQDQWELVPLIEKQASGTLGFHDLWAQHNEHRIFLPRVFMLGSASLTHWNVKYEMAISWVFAVLSFVVLLAILYSYKKLREQRWLFVGVGFLSSTMLFSYNQAENWIWGWQMQWFMANFFVLLTVLVLATQLIRNANHRLIAAICTATLATYSLGNGQYAWFAGIFILYATGQRLRYWLVAATVILTSYYYKFNFLDGEGLHGIIKHPVLSAKYFLAYIGNPVTNDRSHAILVGLTGCVAVTISLSVYFYQRGWTKNFLQSVALIAMPLSLIGYAAFSGFITTMSRARLGIDQALASRYISVGLFLWVGLVLLITIQYLQQTKKVQNAAKVYLSAALSFMIVISLVRSSTGLVYLKALGAERLVSQQCSQAQQFPPEECIKKVYFPGNQALGGRLEYVKYRHLAGYY